MESNLIFIVIIIALALVFEFTNGFHDAANAIATIVSTRVMTPLQAVIWAAFFNFIAFLFFKLSIAKTIGTGLIEPSVMSPMLIFIAFMSATIWNIVTWYFGLPSSSSHSLIGGLVGAAFAINGVAALQWGGFTMILIAIIVSPFLGIITAFILTKIVTKISQNFSAKKSNKFFKHSQIFSSALLSITHGANDAQKSMGIIAALLFSASYIGPNFFVPMWVVISCYLSIAFGTLCGGWRIVNTMGNKITKLNPLRGACAESSSAFIIFIATHAGIPIPTTHVVTGAITGSGLSANAKQTRWDTLRRIFLIWLITIPGTALIAVIVHAAIGIFKL